MKLNIHMLDVGNADSIIVESVDAFGQKFNLLVDGGKREHSEKVIKYLKDHRIVPHIVICTHLDHDHVGGLIDVVEVFKKDIKYVLAHLPEEHDGTISNALMERASVDERLQLVNASMNDLQNFIKTVRGNRIEIIEPFSDRPLPSGVKKYLQVWKFKILGPTVSFYEDQLSKFKETFSPKINDSFTGLYEHIVKSSSDPCSVLGGSRDTPENESSLIFEISSFYKNFLFTGDAGPLAFNHIWAQLNKYYWLKCPHHGSRKSLSREMIDLISPQRVFISSNGNGHPDPSLLECLRGRPNIVVRCTHESGNLIESVH